MNITAATSPEIESHLRAAHLENLVLQIRTQVDWTEQYPSHSHFAALRQMVYNLTQELHAEPHAAILPMTDRHARIATE